MSLFKIAVLYLPLSFWACYFMFLFLSLCSCYFMFLFLCVHVTLCSCYFMFLLLYVPVSLCFCFVPVPLCSWFLMFWFLYVLDTLCPCFCFMFLSWIIRFTLLLHVLISLFVSVSFGNSRVACWWWWLWHFMFFPVGTLTSKSDHVCLVHQWRVFLLLML